MAEALAFAAMRENPDIKELLEFLKSSGLQSHRQEYESLLNGVDAIIEQYSTILSELDALKEKVSKITDKKNPIVVMVENLEALASDIGAKLKNLKDGILSFTKNTLDTAKEKGLSALGAAFKFIHVKDGLQAMSNGFAKSVEGLNKAVARVDNLERHSREKTVEREGGEATSLDGEQAVSLADLLTDIRVDFENLSPDELDEVYKKLLAIGMNNELTANENVCLQYLLDEVSGMLPDRGEYEPTQEAEIEIEQGEEM